MIPVTTYRTEKDAIAERWLEYTGDGWLQIDLINIDMMVLDAIGVDRSNFWTPIDFGRLLESLRTFGCPARDTRWVEQRGNYVVLVTILAYGQISPTTARTLIIEQPFPVARALGVKPKTSVLPTEDALSDFIQSLSQGEGEALHFMLEKMGMRSTGASMSKFRSWIAKGGGGSGV